LWDCFCGLHLKHSLESVRKPRGRWICLIFHSATPMQNAKPENSWASPLMRRLHAPIYRRRISVLTDTILAHVQANDLILDVGCGSGALGRAILDSRICPRG